MLAGVTTKIAAGDVLDAELQTLDGEATTLRAWLHGGALVVTFLRHFG